MGLLHAGVWCMGYGVWCMMYGVWCRRGYWLCEAQDGSALILRRFPGGIAA